MQINEVAYKWAGQLTRRTATRRIILHHAAAVTCTPQQVHQWHLANGWTGIGYHFFVRKDGTVYRGRPEDTVGAHAGNNNYDSLGVCFEGSFDRETMPDAQLRAGQELVAYLKQKYGISTVQRHSDVNATGCPGGNFPFDVLAGAQAAKPAVPAPVDLRHDADTAIADYRQPRRYRALCTGGADRTGLRRRRGGRYLWDQHRRGGQAFPGIPGHCR